MVSTITEERSAESSLLYFQIERETNDIQIEFKMRGMFKMCFYLTNDHPTDAIFTLTHMHVGMTEIGRYDWGDVASKSSLSWGMVIADFQTQLVEKNLLKQNLWYLKHGLGGQKYELRR